MINSVILLLSRNTFQSLQVLQLSHFWTHPYAPFFTRSCWNHSFSFFLSFIILLLPHTASPLAFFLFWNGLFMFGWIAYLPLESCNLNATCSTKIAIIFWRLLKVDVHFVSFFHEKAGNKKCERKNIKAILMCVYIVVSDVIPDNRMNTYLWVY